MKFQKRYPFFVCFIILLTFSNATSATFYIDSEYGDDLNNGTSESTPWNTIERINQSDFQPGDKILFKRGCIWKGTTLEFPSSGTIEDPIIISDYGDSDKPIISVKGSINGWDTPENWSHYQSNIWSVSCENDPYRIWLSETEYKEAFSRDHIDENSCWFYDHMNSQLYVFSPENPAVYYYDIEKSGITENAVVIAGKCHIIIKNLDIRGGSFGSLAIYGSDYIVIEDCVIGRDAGATGVWIEQKIWLPIKDSSNHGTIRRCIIDSGHRLAYTFDHVYPEDGIHLRNGANDWQIYDNQIIDWGHTGIDIYQFDPNHTVSHNKIYSNTISAEHTGYCRGFSCKGLERGCQFNEFAYNIVRNTTVRNQIGGDHNRIYYNIIHQVRNSDYKVYGTAQGISLGVWDDFVCHHNKIFNNTIYNCDEVGISLHATEDNLSIQYNEIKNNIIYNCGLNSKDGMPLMGVYIADQPFIKNNSIQNNLISNSGTNLVINYRSTELSVDAFNLQKNVYNDTISDNIQSDPMFLNPENHDFGLFDSSPCIDTGTDVDLFNDFFNTSVPQGIAVDIGAVEFIKVSSVSENKYNSTNENRSNVWPNPFHLDQHTFIMFSQLPSEGILRIYDIMGRKIQEIDLLANSRYLSSGGKIIFEKKISTSICFYSISVQNRLKASGKFMVVK